MATKKKRDPHLACEEHCGDCIYFGFVTSDTGRMWCCDYTFKTGKLKPLDQPVAKCTVKIKKIREKELHADQ